MGNDLRELSPTALSILNNPAIIAINQDPEGRSVARIRREFVDQKDKYGMGEIQVWSGSLYGGDQVVILLNAAGEDLEISAGLDEIFLHDGPEGSAPQVQEEWEVYDLWADRMDEELAREILDADTEKATELLKGANWYNSTETPYKEGIKNRDERLMGKKVGTIKPGGAWTTTVKKHAAEIYRLKSVSNGGKRKSHTKEEL
jgi:alpha-galactosidase